ncbi:branched-chain amino acid ABC transporter permease [Variovorax paradoxus]|nr:branched-chain amino acid ABC transporter permease [Variovorax paradoxus]MBT2301949.1 branched-chain amino acid ABC transporter permease [Variovorax paradoxus]
MIASAVASAPLPLQSWPRAYQWVLTWSLAVAATLLVPLVFNNNASLTFLSQMATMIVFCLSYNLLMGQGGMLSFGHALYSGMGAYFTIYAMNWAAAATGWKMPLVFVPLAGGLAGMVFGVVLGYVATKKAGTAFAMITLGLGELAHAAAQMFPRFFGGESGVAASRTYGEPFLGLSFGPQIQVYYLIAGWTLLSAFLMYAFTQTPLGRIANAVRDNAERAEFVGYDTRKVRYIVFIVATFFAGVSGGLAAINFEIVSAESMSALRSADALIFTFIGGAGYFLGPVLGAILGSFLNAKLSDYTVAWQLYLGALFVLFVMYAPAGVAGIVAGNWRVLRAGMFRRVLPQWLMVVGAALVLVVGAVILVELCYAVTLGSDRAAVVKLLAELSQPQAAALWAAGVALVVAGLFVLQKARRVFRQAWNAAQGEINDAQAGGAR